MTIEQFKKRMSDFASTAEFTPPWAWIQFWVTVMAPFLAEASKTGDDEVKQILTEAIPIVHKSQSSAFEWLSSFLLKSTPEKTKEEKLKKEMKKLKEKLESIETLAGRKVK